MRLRTVVAWLALAVACSACGEGVDDRNHLKRSTTRTNAGDDGEEDVDAGRSAGGASSGTATGAGASGATPSAPSSTGGASDAGAGGDAGGAAAKKALGDGPCATGDECASAVCFVGGQGSYCSLACTQENAAQVCVAPFNGVCNNQGRCKKP